uniref:FA core complex associated protein 24 n=1 Tax=Leptobrachium leishanense TaxID=445787 RepID=A0A8C5MGW4_9ANUR
MTGRAGSHSSLGVFCGGLLVVLRRSSGAVALVTSGKIRLLFEDGLGLVDFHIANRTCILYISEADIVAGNAFKRRLVQFRKACNLKGIVIVEKTRLSDQYLPPVQTFVVLELGMVLLPVANKSEAAQLLINLVLERSKERTSNPFIGKKSCQFSSTNILSTVQTIPGVGKVTALQLLQHFPSIHQLANASHSQLEAVVGHGTASNVHAFFTRT